MLRADVLVDMHVEGKLPGLRLMAERTRDHFEKRGEQDFFRVDRHGAGFDLGEVENVADEVQEIGTGRMDGAREVDLLVGEIAVRVLGELLAENEDAVERGAQLVRHVGEEFRFVLRRERKLGRLFLQRPPRLLDFLVLALDLDVALGELLRLLLELLVGLLQFPLLRLQFARRVVGTA